MAQGLETTFRILARTENEAAVELLTAALDSPCAPLQEGALRALVERRSPVGHQEVLRRLGTAPPSWQPLLQQRPGRLGHALREAVLGQDLSLCDNACQAILWLREYDLAPALVKALEDESLPGSSLAATTLLSLVELLYDELATPRETSRETPRPRDPKLLRRNVVASLELSVLRYASHKRIELIESFLLLASRDNSVLRQVLADPRQAACLALIERLTHSLRPGIMRLVLSFLDDPQAPSAALTVVSRRTDRKFVEHLLRKVGSEPSGAVKINLKHVESIAWLRNDWEFLDGLDDAGQHSVVQLVMSSAMSREARCAVLAHLLEHGKVRGRRAAIAALANFNGAETNQLALRALIDPDPQVQAAAVAQLRPRGIPGALTLFIEALDNPLMPVRQAAREGLVEFTFARYLAAFDGLDEEVRHSSAHLVRKVDPQLLPQLRAELESDARRRRIRGAAVATALGVVRDLEPVLIGLLGDEDHHVRLEAVRALAASESAAAREALEAARHDSSVAVQLAAASSLEQLEQFALLGGASPAAEPSHV